MLAMEQKREQPILSKELQFTVDLKLTNKDIKSIIDKSIQSAESLKEKLCVKGISYPNDYVFASLANRAYEERKNVNKTKDLYGKKLDQALGNWQLLTVAYNNVISDGYVGAAYWNPDVQQIIIAHRGTDPKDPSTLFGTLFNDIKGIFLNQHSPQIDSAVTFTEKIISILPKNNQENSPCIQLFFTGHSLGGWLAQITTFTANYLIRDGDNFVKNRDFEKTGYHARAVVFDSPGCKSMLERLQDRFMYRYGPSYINSLDIISYLSAPNIINACNPQTGEIYRIIRILSEQDKLWMEESFLGYIRLMHNKEKIKEVFDPETGIAQEDERGKLRIEKVIDWPLLISGYEEAFTRDKVVWGANLLSSFLLPGWVTTVSECAYWVYSKKKWYDELKQELNSFFKSANEYNNYHLNDESAHIEIGENIYRSIRYKTQELNKNYKNEQSINAFTQLERQFLETYKLLENHQKELPDQFKFKNLFSSLKEHQELKKKTMAMLKNYKILNSEEKIMIHSENLQEFIPYIKHILHFFPEMKSEVEEAQQSLPIHTLSVFYQSASSSYLKSLKNSLEIENDSLKLCDFFNCSNYKILHAVQLSASLATSIIYKIFQKVKNSYSNDECHGFFSLDRISYLGDSLFVGFLKKVKNKYLLVVECDSILNYKVKRFLERLFECLQENHNVNAKYLKIILASEKGSDLSKFISRHVENNQSMCQEKNSEVRFNDLTPDSQVKLLEKTVVFQGKEVILRTIINRESNKSLDVIIDSDTIAELLENKRIEIGKALPSLGEIENYYIERELIKKVKVKEDVLKNDNLTELFAISNINKELLSRLTGGKKVRNFEEEDSDGSNPTRFITLNQNVDGNFRNLCDRYVGHTIHWLERINNGDLIWIKSHGKTISGLRRYIENYEKDLPENDYSRNNTSIKMVNVKDINKFDDKLIIIAAEPGMGKTTALTRFGTQKADESKWLIRINLVEYKDELERINFIRDVTVVDFLRKNNFLSSSLGKKLLESRLNNSGNIVFLLDGFDEITSEAQKNTINLISILQKTKVEKIIISTRLHLRNELENVFSTVAYTLKPFLREDQKRFLEKFWQRPNIDTKERLDNYIDKLLKFIKKSIGDKERKFMGIPMQIRMVAEAFQEATKKQELLDKPEFTFPENFDMLKLYDCFLYAKYLVYFGKIGAERVNLNNPTRRNWFTTRIRETHEKLSFKELFSDVEPQVINNFIGEEPVPEADKQEINLVGLAQFIDDKIIFTHRTFGEYFASDFLFNRLSNRKNSQVYETTTELLAKQLFENKNEVIKTFLDYRLAKEEIHAAILKGKLDDVILSVENVNVADALGRNALHYAAQEGLTETEIKKFVSYCEDMRKPDELGKTALHYAARYNHGKQTISCLLENANDCINSKDKNGCAALYYAAQQGDWGIVDFLIERGADTNVLDQQALIFHYTYQNKLTSVKILVEQGVDIATKDNHCNTLLHIASKREYLAIVDFLLGKGVNASISNNSGKKAISYAVEKENWGIVESLLRKKAEFNDLSDSQKLSLLKHSAGSAHWDIVKLFIEDDGRDIYFGHLSDEQKVGLLCYTTEKENWYIIEFLLKKGANFNDLNGKQKLFLIDHFARTLNWKVVKLFMEDHNRLEGLNRNDYFQHLGDKQMHCLCYLISVGNLDISKFFIEKLIENEKITDVNTANTCGKTFLHLAAQDGKLNIVQYLVDEKKADLDAVTSRGSTALHFASGNSHLEVVKYLVVKGTDLTVTNTDGKTPTNLATEKGFINIVTFLEQAQQDRLVEAAKQGNYDMVENLINHGAKVNGNSSNGNIALHEAIKDGRLEVVQYLVKIGADVNIYDKDTTPLSLAGKGNEWETAVVLLRSGANIDDLNHDQKQNLLIYIDSKHYSSDRFPVDKLLTSLGNAYGDLGDHKKQKELLERAVEIQEKHYGRSSFEITRTLVSLSKSYGDLHDPKLQKELLERALAIQRNHYGCEHFEVAKTQIELANAYGYLGDHKRKKELLELALPISTKHYGREHFEVANILVSLGNACGALGDPQKQKELLEQALVINKKHYGLEHFQVAIAFIHLGNAYGDLGDHEKKKELLECALSINKKHYSLRHFMVARTLGNLGNAYGALGNPKKQKEHLEWALEIQEKHYGSEHFEVACTLKNLGNAYGALGDPKKQKELLERALPVVEKHYGHQHFEVASTLMNLSNAYMALGDPKKQKELLERVLPIYETHYGSEHFQVASALLNLGNAYGNLGKYKKKKDLLERVLPIFEKHYGREHFQVASALVNLGNAYGNLGEPKKQKELLQRALPIKEKYYGYDHFEVANTLVNLSNAFGQLGDPKKQKELLERALPVKEKHYGLEHYEVAVTLINLGNAYGDLSDHKKKKELLERALHIYEKHYGREHFQVAIALVNLGNAYGDLGDKKRKQELLERALAINEKHYGPGHVMVARTLGNLGNAYGALGDPENQKRLLERALPILEEHYGSKHFMVAQTKMNLGNAYGMLDCPRTQKELLEYALPILEEHYGANHPFTLMASSSIEEANKKISSCNIQHYRKQQNAFLDLSKFVSHHISLAKIELVKQELYLPSFEARNIEVEGKCVTITRGISQALLSQNDKHFFNNLKTCAEVYERIAQGKQISKREEREVFTFSKLLDDFERQLDSSMNSLPSSLIFNKGYMTICDLPNYIAEIIDDFAIHLVTSNHVVAIYRIGDNYAYFDSNIAFISRLKSVDQLMKIVKGGVQTAGYKMERKCLLVEHFDVAKANNLLSREYKQILAKEIKTERQLLAKQDKEFGLIEISSRKLSRVQLYDFGTKINVEGSVPLLINAGMELNNKKIQDHLNKKEVSMTAKEYLDNLKDSNNIEIIQATKLIPFIGSSREKRDAEQTRKPLLKHLVKETVNFITRNLTTAIFANVCRFKNQLQGIDNNNKPN